MTGPVAAIVGVGTGAGDGASAVRLGVGVGVGGSDGVARWGAVVVPPRKVRPWPCLWVTIAATGRPAAISHMVIV
ncbi:MAG TPA: hypothetical protein VMK84_08895, partial [Streptosporangiaceae bacterium]|nr:hypothetical protein [Streptosporangiaceae bacterium]